MRSFLIAFGLYTVLGLASEAVSTGVGDLFRRLRDGIPLDRTLPCRTQLWSIPVYGLSAAVGFALIAGWTPELFSWPWWARGACYMLGIFAWEFFWGWLLETILGECPWRYVDSPSAWRRYINPTFAPLWFGFGFALEAVQVWILPRLCS